MTATRCATKCGRPARGGVICPACCHRLAVALRAVPALVVELETSFSRQTASGRSEGGRSSERPMSYGVQAAEVLRVLDAALTDAARALDPLTLETGRLSVGATARWLNVNIGEVRQYDQAAGIFERVTKAVTAGELAVDRRPDRWYAGTCGFDGDGREVACAAELYVDEGEPYVDCPSCGERWDVKDRRDVLMAASSDRLANASTLAAALTYMGRPMDPARIRQWAKRGKIKALDVNLKGQPLYRVGDVVTLIHEAESHYSDKVVERLTNPPGTVTLSSSAGGVPE